MNQEEAVRWDEAHRRNRDQPEPLLAITVHVTPAEYERLKRDASWESCSVAEYLRRKALGRIRRGC